MVWPRQRWDPPGAAADEDGGGGGGGGEALFVDLGSRGAVLSESEAAAKAGGGGGGAAAAALEGVSHVQLYLCTLHDLVDYHSRVGDEGQVRRRRRPSDPAAGTSASI